MRPTVEEPYTADDVRLLQQMRIMLAPPPVVSPKLWRGVGWAALLSAVFYGALYLALRYL